MNIFVGNVAPQVTEAEIEALFDYGQMKSVQVTHELFSGARRR